MPWSTRVMLDAGSAGAGIVTATFSDSDGTSFPFTARIDGTQKGDADFVAAAISARNAWQAGKKAAAAVQSSIQNALTQGG